MEFTDKRCPVCGVPFQEGDDIVVCPECGTPQHRTCYERLGKCANAEHHGEDFSWNENEEKESAAFAICPHCGAKNPKDAIFCNACATPLTNNNTTDNSNQQQAQSHQFEYGPQGVPFGGFGSFTHDTFYANNGIAPTDKVADNVTVDDAEKFVKSNYLYYIPLFRNIKRFGRSRFNFSAAIFSGAWFLYRKLYVLGTVFTALSFLCMFAESFFLEVFADTYSSILQTLGTTGVTSYDIVQYAFTSGKLSTYELIGFIIPPITSFMRIVIMIVGGCIANRSYYKHSVKKIKKIKSENPANLTEALGSAGGTSYVGPIIVAVCYVALNIIATVM